MYAHMIVPQAPLVFRSGRPFGEGSRDGANFPWPSSLAGVLRSQVMDDRGWHGKLDDAQQQALRDLAAHGPILAERCRDGLTPMLPKPADALLLVDDAGGKAYHRLLPGKLPAGCACDLPPGLQPLLLAGDHKGKPQAGPAFWSLARLLAWRRGEAVAAFEHDEPLRETRSHVALSRATLAADPGRLFQTEGLDFSRRRRASGRGFGDRDWVFLCRFAQVLSGRMLAFGGEGRLSRLDTAPDDALAAPPDYLTALANARHITLTLATPALFADGWRPRWLDEGDARASEAGASGTVPGIPGLQLVLKAAAVDRWQGISGWDLATWDAKPARKAVAAGATYWFEVVGDPPAGWAERLWLVPISDQPQDRRDGFGLVIPGFWNERS
jgi:CRISPR-associated protein (Cas_Cmr3).